MQTNLGVIENELGKELAYAPKCKKEGAKKHMKRTKKTRRRCKVTASQLKMSKFQESSRNSERKPRTSSRKTSRQNHIFTTPTKATFLTNLVCSLHTTCVKNRRKEQRSHSEAKEMQGRREREKHGPQGSCR